WQVDGMVSSFISSHSSIDHSCRNLLLPGSSSLEDISKIGIRRFAKSFFSRQGSFRRPYSRSLGKKRNKAWRKNASKSTRGIFEMASNHFLNRIFTKLVQKIMLK